MPGIACHSDYKKIKLSENFDNYDYNLKTEYVIRIQHTFIAFCQGRNGFTAKFFTLYVCEVHNVLQIQQCSGVLLRFMHSGTIIIIIIIVIVIKNAVIITTVCFLTFGIVLFNFLRFLCSYLQPWKHLYWISQNQSNCPRTLLISKYCSHP